MSWRSVLDDRTDKVTNTEIVYGGLSIRGKGQSAVLLSKAQGSGFVRPSMGWIYGVIARLFTVRTGLAWTWQWLGSVDALVCLGEIPVPIGYEPLSLPTHVKLLKNSRIRQCS